MTQQRATGPILFHLAFPVTNIAAAKAYYGEGLGCAIGRESEQAVILNLYGHQLVAHLTHAAMPPQVGIYPRHFGLVFAEFADWQALRDRATVQNLQFYLPPKIRFPDQQLEHHTFFLEDPFSNLMEFKFYRHAAAIFGGHEHALIGDRS